MEPIYDHCGNCGYSLEPGDVYCRNCGAKAGEGSFDPMLNIMQCIYGPAPIERKHTCSKCGYSWNTVLMLDYESHCPKCGGAAPYEEIREE